MDHTLIRIGLPVKCAYGDCGTKDFVKPNTDYGGWYKSKMFRFKPRKRWFCPEHYEFARNKDNHFYENYKTPDPYIEEAAQAKTVDELYDLID